MEVRAASRSGRSRDSSGDHQVEVDWTKPSSLEAACAGVTGVVHLASPNAQEVASRPECLREVEAGNLALCRAMERHHIQRAVYLSTIHVYGDALAGTVCEETPLRPVHPYGKMHARTESILAASRLPWVILRSTNGVGWPVRPETNCWMLLANDLCRQGAVSGAIRLHGDGRAYRDFLPLQEILRAVRHFLCGKPDSAGVYLLGSGITRTTGWLAKEIADEFARQTRRPPFPPPGEVSPAGPPPFVLDPGRIRSLGFQPEASLEGELNGLVSRCRQWFSTENVTAARGNSRVQAGA